MRSALVFGLVLFGTSDFGGCQQNTQPTTPPARPAPAPAPPPRTKVPAQVANPVVQLAARNTHTCALRKDGSVLCWGRNTYGQLGNGRREPSASAVAVKGLVDAKQVAVGRDFSCALRRSGTVVCWGNNEDGQLGDGRGGRPAALSLRPVGVANLKGIRQISLGEYFGCALGGKGKVRCWGNAENGQIGSDRQRAFNTPLPIDRLGPVKEVAAGGSHVCALETSGTVKCWGRNTEGQLGDGNSGSRIKAVVVANLEDATHIASGINHTCAARPRGGAVCWGDNVAHQLGPAAGNERKRRTPIAVKGLTGVKQLSGGGSHSCALLGGGRVVCWGGNEAGQLGHKSSARSRSQPTPVRGVADAIGLALGTAHTCAARRSGEVACWGSGDDGALGPHRLAKVTAKVDDVGSF